MRAFLLAVLLLLGGSYCPATAQECFEYGPSVSLSGRIRSRIFPGPPNYESIRKGDRKETVSVLTLAKTICTTGAASEGLDVPETGVREVQLVITRNADEAIVQRLMGTRAIVSGVLFHAHTAHHRTKVLLRVSTITPPHNNSLNRSGKTKDEG
jgi:Domain of unknown function (DUF4431)